MADAAASGDSVAQQGIAVTVALRDSVAIRLLRVYVDSATRPTPDQSVDYTQPYGLTPAAASRSVVVFPATLGTHVITVAVTDTSGHVASASLTRTFAVPAAAYTVTALPGIGGDAHGADVHADGDAVGWVATPAGRKRPALWRAGRLTVLPVTDSVDVTARRVNSAGDILLQYSAWSYDARPVRVWRADGTLVPLGPAHYAFRPGDTTFNRCCLYAGELNDRGVATGLGGGGSFPSMTARFDAASGALRDTVAAWYPLLNSAGQMAGTKIVGDLYFTTSVVTEGFTLPGLPPGPSAARRCSLDSHPVTTVVPVDLDDAASVLVAYECTAYAYLSASGSVWLDRYLGRSVGAHLSRQGGLVASLDSAGAVTVWTAATKRVVRVQAALGAVKLDGLDGVNATGQILVHGVDATTSKAGAFLLTPSTR